MQRFPDVSYPGGTGAFDEILINDQGLDFRNITIDYTAQYGVIPKFTLYGRQTIAPYKYAPFKTLITGDWTKTTNDTIALATALLAGCISATDDVYIWDVSGGVQKGIITTGLPLAVDTVVDTLITLVGTFDLSSYQDDIDFLVVADGTELSKDVVIVLEEIDFTALYTSGKDYVTNALYAGNINPNKINRYSYLTPADVQRLRFYVP